MPSLPWSGSRRRAARRARKKIAAITRYVTVAIGLLQGFGYYTLIRTQGGGTMLDTAGLPWLVGGYRHRTVLHCRLRLCHVAG